MLRTISSYLSISIFNRPYSANTPSQDLPPNVVARPLSISKSALSNGIFTSEVSSSKRDTRKRKRKNNDADDTPKAFARLMAFQAGKKLPKSLDDGVKAPKAKRTKQMRNKGADGGDVEGDGEGQQQELKGSNLEVPEIRPGERMSDFAARVDAALPVSGLINKSTKSGKDPLNLKVGRTKTERRMHKMYADWRAEDARIKERREEALELAEEEAEDEDGNVRWKVDIDGAAEKTGNGNGKKKGKGKKKRLIGEVNDGDDDPWARLKESRGEGKAGLHDVVLAPPTFRSVPKEKFKVRGARVEVEDVPKASGSLRRREELGEVRKSVVEGYRAMMKNVKETARLES
jgi:hypothetical protein